MPNVLGGIFLIVMWVAFCALFYCAVYRTIVQAVKTAMRELRQEADDGE